MEKELTVSEHGFAGVLYEGSSCPDRAVIYVDGGGSSRKDALQAASFIRKQGFMLLVLGYYGWPGTPEKMEGIPVEYTERAIHFLKAEYNIPNIIMTGVSEGAVYSLLCASLISDIHAVCAVAPLDHIISSPSSGRKVESVYTWRGKTIPFTRFSSSSCSPLKLLTGALFTEGYGFRRMVRYACDQVRVSEESIIQVENIQAELLLIVPSSDDIWGSEDAVLRMADRLRRCGYRYPVHTKIIQNGSHIMGGSYDFSAKGMRLMKYLLKAEHNHANECDVGRKVCLDSMLKFFSELIFPTHGDTRFQSGEECE